MREVLPWWLGVALTAWCAACGTNTALDPCSDFNTDTCNSVEYHYRCSAGACGSDAQRKACVGERCTDWISVKTCLAHQICWANEQGVGCTTCEFGCLDGACLACNAGPCCDDGSIRSSGSSCVGDEYQSVETQCCQNAECQVAGTACGDDFFSRNMTQTCDGISAECKGSVEPIGSWTLRESCDVNSYCSHDTGCMPCDKGCWDGGCKECTDADGSCCDKDSYKIRSAGSECNPKFGFYCSPTGCGGVVVAIQTYQVCDGATTSCGGSSYDKILSQFYCSREQICVVEEGRAGCDESTQACGGGL